MSTAAVVSLCIFLCYLGVVRTDTETDGYSGEVKALFEDLTSYKTNIASAKTKISTSEGTWDRKYAIGVINLYTQQSKFYSTLNYEMRNMYPDNTTDIWKRAGDLINRGLDILGPTIHSLLYRGCRNINTSPVVGEDFLFNQITSTSTSKSIAEGFISCKNGNLFKISNVYGVAVSSFSQFSFEGEVIIKSCNIFKVDKGPIKENSYNVYYLNGQADVNGIDKDCTLDENDVDRERTWDENGVDINRTQDENGVDRERTWDENNAERPGAGIIPNYVTSMLLSLSIVLCH
ncbi:uncharacterized protein LOC128550437 isoform X1 [Mercenaria mercenaria]|uniref:uncharacterized protein LOC128550437 isoform X1 n=1 Tax=Mercenaria mercenaria TaxID=6596 RepID=UPI00234F7A8E|nr:uncharacterized protein LOC128550437 isoform X1 [Mercenaria mercenaria]